MENIISLLKSLYEIPFTFKTVNNIQYKIYKHL